MCSKIERRTHAESVEPTVACALLAVALGQQEIPLDLHVGVQKPVQAERHIGDPAAVDRIVGQVEITQTKAHLPGAAAADAGTPA